MTLIEKIFTLGILTGLGWVIYQSYLGNRVLDKLKGQTSRIFQSKGVFNNGKFRRY